MKITYLLNHLFCATLILLAGAGATLAQVPQLLNYQGRIAVNGTNYTGIGQFKFALVDGGSNSIFNSYWSNDGSSSNGSQPAASVPLTVTKGLYSVLLGDTTLSNMAVLPANVFANSDVRLRVWFNDGITGFQQLTPDQRLAAVGYAIMAGTVPDGSITTSKIAPGISGLMSFQIPATTNVQAVANSVNLFTNTQTDTLTLPANPNAGDCVQATAGAGGFTIIANNGQSILDPPSFGLTSSGPSGRWAFIASSSDGSKLIAGQNADSFGNPGYLYTSTNSGITWTQQTNAGAGNWEGVASSSDGNKLIAGQFADSSGDLGNSYLYTSTNSGVTWTQQTNAGAGSWECVASSSDGSKLIAGQFEDSSNNLGHLYTSTNYGVSWTQQTNAGPGYWACVASSSDGSRLIAGESGDSSGDDNGHLYTSTNSGVTWTQQTNSGAGNWEGVASSSDGNKLIAGQFADSSGDLGTGYLYTSTNSGVTWTQQIKAGAGSWECVASSSDGTKLLAAQFYFSGFASGFIYYSTDSGLTWTRPPNTDSHSWASIASSSDGSKSFAATGFELGTLYVLPNYITHWSTLYVYGNAYGNIDLVYAGGGLWVPTSYSGSFTIQ